VGELFGADRRGGRQVPVRWVPCPRAFSPQSFAISPPPINSPLDSMETDRNRDLALPELVLTFGSP
jgi:hypothetical protein